MQVSLEAIKFNHDPGAATSDALNIRRNETEAVTVPEWRKGVSILPDDSPAAYAIKEIGDRQITIQARFKCVEPETSTVKKCVDPETNTVEIRAVDPTKSLEGRTGNALGEVVSRQIRFDSNGETQFETFTLDCIDLEKRGVSSSVTTWIWQYRVEDSDWCPFTTTRHRVYTILEMPKCAWVQQPFDGRNPQLPWTEVLDYACEWAKGARDRDEAAARITKAVFDLGQSLVVYDSAPCYANFDNFDCTSLLSLFRDDRGMGQRFNCEDCATIVSTFANVLGCDLWQSQIGLGFNTHPIRLIGSAAFESTFFDYHEVAWKDCCSFEDDLFDACMELDGDECPSEPPHEGVLGIQTKFGTAQVGTYRFRLSPLPRVGPDGCQPRPQERKRRLIGLNTQPTPESTAECPDADNTDQGKSDFTDPRDPRPVREAFSIDPNVFEENRKIGDWEIYRVRYLKKADVIFGAFTLWFLPQGDPEYLMRADVYEFDSVDAATREKQRLLDRYQMKDVKVGNQQTFRGIDFIPVTNTAFLGQFERVLVEGRSVGRKDLLTGEFYGEFLGAFSDLIRSPSM